MYGIDYMDDYSELGISPEGCIVPMSLEDCRMIEYDFWYPFMLEFNLRTKGYVTGI